MRVSIDTNTLIDDRVPSKDLLSFNASQNALKAVQRLAEQGNDLIYYTARREHVETWLERQRFPRGQTMHYHSVLHKLVTIYENEQKAGSALLIDAQWQEVIEEFQKLGTGGYVTRVSYWREVTAFLFGYLRLFVFGGMTMPLTGMIPAVAHIPSWEEASGVLNVFRTHR